MVEVAAVATVVTVGATATYATYRAVDSLGNSSSSSSGFHLERKTIWDWWGNGLTGWERTRLLELGHSDRGGCFRLEELKSIICRADKEPGVPTKDVGYEPPSNWDGKLKKVPDGNEKGYPHKDGSVWVPTGEGGNNPEGKPHGGAHWDIHRPHDKSGWHENKYPDGTSRWSKKKWIK